MQRKSNKPFPTNLATPKLYFSPQFWSRVPTTRRESMQGCTSKFPKFQQSSPVPAVSGGWGHFPKGTPLEDILLSPSHPKWSPSQNSSDLLKDTNLVLFFQISLTKSPFRLKGTNLFLANPCTTSISITPFLKELNGELSNTLQHRLRQFLLPILKGLDTKKNRLNELKSPYKT